MIKRDKQLSENVFQCPIHVKCLFETNEPQKQEYSSAWVNLR